MILSLEDDFVRSRLFFDSRSAQKKPIVPEVVSEPKGTSQVCRTAKNQPTLMRALISLL
ncbi:hypothetical protein D3C72_984060 [compost metagenome]